MKSLHEKRLCAVDQKKYLTAMIKARKFHKTHSFEVENITQEEKNRIELMAF